MRDATVQLKGRILYLSEDPAFVGAQLAGEDPEWTPTIKLRDDISTDEITPAYICYYYDETLGEFPYLGLKCRDECCRHDEWTAQKDRAAATLPPAGSPHQTSCRRPGANPGRGPK